MKDDKKTSLRQYLHSGGSKQIRDFVVNANPVAVYQNEHESLSSAYDSQWIDDNLNNKQTQESDDKSSIFDLFKRESTPGGILDSYNLMQEKRLQGDLNAAKNDLTQLNWKKKEIELAEQYMKDQQELEQLKQEMSLLDESSNPNVYKQYQSKLSEVQERINNAEEWIKTEGKHSDILRSLFFDTTKKGDINAQLDSWLYSTFFDKESVKGFKQALQNALSVTDNYTDVFKALTESKNPLQAAFKIGVAGKQGLDKMSQSVISGGEALIQNAAGAAANFFNLGRRTIRGDEFSKEYNGRIDQSIRESDINDRTYDSFFTSGSEIKNNNNLLNRFQQNLEYWKGDVDEKIENKTQDAQDISRKLLKGTWYFKPELIDPKFREAQAHTDVGLLGTITHPLYSFPELGSSFSDFEDFATLTATDAGVSVITSETVLKWLAKKASTVAIGGPVGKLLKVASALNTVNDIRKIQTVAGALEMVPNIVLTNRMRQNETKQEVFDAYSNRVLNRLFEEGIDPRTIAAAADKKWIELQEALPESERVAAPASLEEKIGLALSLGVDINDERWDDIQTEARKGLTKLYNENMALAAKDYAEGLVFMPYAGKVFKNALFRRLETPLAYQTAEFQQKLGTTRALKPLVENGTATVLQKAEYHAHRIAEKKLASLLSPTAAVSAARIGKFVKNKVNQLMKIAPLEGIEEGQQHLLQTRYQEGKYDDYQRAETRFMDIASLLNDQELAVQALASYAGINNGDPTNGDAELRRAMNIGFTTAMWFQSPQVVTNLLPTRLTHADNMRNLIASVKTDMSLKRLVGENYARIQDDNHIGKFFDIYGKYGITGERVADTLEEMKKYKGDLVTDQYIDEDVELARETYNQYNSEYLNDVRADRNIAKNSQEHKFLVQNAVREIRDFKRAVDLATKNEKDLTEKQDQILREILNELKDVPYGRNGDYSHLGGKYKKFIQRTLQDYNRLREDQENARETWENNEALIEEAVERLKRRQHLTESEARTNAKEEVRKWVFDDYTEAERAAGAKGMQYMSVEDFVEDRLNTIIEYSKLPIYKKLIDDLSKREQLQKLIQDETGTDINTENLSSIIDVLKNRREEIRQHAQKNVDNINNQRDYFNEVILPSINKLRKAIGKNERPPQRHTNIQGLVNQYGDLGFTDDVTRLIMLEALNTAVAQQLQPRAMAYEFGAVNPYAISLSIRPKKFSELSESRKQEYARAKLEEAQAKGQKEPTRLQIGQMYNKEQQERMKKFNDLKKKYKKVKAQSFLQGSLDNAENAIANAESDINEADMLAVQKEAASLFIEQQLDEKIENYQERMKIYHTQQKEVSEETHVSEQPIDSQPVHAEESSPIETEELHPDLDPLTGSEMSDEMRQALNLDSQGDTTQEAAIAKILGEQTAPEITATVPVETVPETTAEEEPAEAPVEQPAETTIAEQSSESELQEEEEQPSAEQETPSHVVDTTPIIDTSENIAGQSNEDINNEDSPDSREEDEPAPEYEDGTTTDEEPIGDISEEEGAAESKDNSIIDEEPYMVEEKSPIEEESYFSEGLEDAEDQEDSSGRRRQRRTKRDISDKDEARAQYLSSLFQYQPNSTKPMYLGVSNDEQKTTPLNLTYKLQSGKALAEKLLDKKWVLSCDVYYICSGNLYQKGRKDKNTVTVSIIIDDHKDKKTYAASMGTPGVYRYGEDVAQEFNGLEKLYSTLNVIGVKDDYVVKDRSGRKRINPSEYNRLRQQILKADYLRSVDERYSSDSELDGKVSQYEKTLSKEQLDNIDYETRKLMAYDRSKIMTKSEMDEQVNALIAARNQIIDQYCQIAADGTITIPKEIRKDVKPAIVEVSDGAFNNLEDDNAPLFRAVNDVKDFGLSSDTEQITNAIENGEVLFGFGRGENSNTPFAISNILDPKQVFDISNRKGETGKAGVLYVLVDTGGKHLVPIQLRTERFETQEGVGLMNEEHNPVVLCINPETGVISTNGDIKPSLAEVILFLACDKLSLNEIPGKDANIGKRILNLVVNCGSNTLLSPDSKSQNYLRELSDKQFSVENIKLGKDMTPTKCLVIAKNEGGIRSQEAIPVDKIFSDDDLRREVIYRIAKNLHWNTEVTQEAKKTSMRDEFPADIVSELRAYFEDNPSATEYKFCGLQQLSFKKSDFFVEEGGELKDKHVSVFAWMIANKHVMTDLGDRIFKDPFIFASGLSSKQSHESAVQEIKQQGGKEKGPGVSIIDKTRNEYTGKSNELISERTTKEKLDKLAELKSYGANPVLRRARVQSVIAQTEEQRKEVVSKSGGEIVDKIALAVEFHKVEGETPEQTYKRQLEQNIQEYLDFANAQKIFDKKLTLADVKGLNIDRNRVQQAVAGGYVPVLIVEKNGTVSFTQQHNSSLRSGAQFTGVFSKVREGQPLTDQEAREFLSKTLGIERHNVLVLDKVFDAMTKKEVFGIMQVSSDILSGDLTGQIVISRQNNLASTYHEAFHYANLLLKTRKERVDLYRQFVSSRRPDLAKASLFDIEEALAEEFKQYVEQRKTNEPKTVFGKIGKFFKDLLDVINIFKKKDLVKYAFDQIIAGKYAPRTIDAQSLSDFVANYPEGAFDRFTIPGQKYEDIEKLKYITDYKTFYGVSQALMNEFIAREDFKTVGDLEKLGEDTPFVNFVEDLVLQNKDDKYRSGILEDVKNNIGIFKAVVFERLQEYGIKATSHKAKIDELKVTNITKEDLGEDPDGQDTGNRDNPAHDIENFQVSKKDNVAFRAKLFLGQIEKRRFEYDELTGEKRAVSVPDRFLGLRQYEPFGEAWTKMLNDLWMCDSFDEIDEKSDNPENPYAKTSLMYKVIMLSKSQPFYTAVREKLESLYHMDEEGNVVKDIQLENQILATIKSQLPITGYMRIQTPQQKKVVANTTEYMSDSDMQAVAKIPGDTDKQVEIFTDQTFRAKRMLPREWSKNAVVSGLVGYTFEDGETKLTLLEAPVKALWNRYSALENQLFDVHKKGKVVTLINKTVRGQQAAKELYDSSVNQLIAILQDMGIPSDESVIENMILQNDASALNDYVKRVAGLQKLLNASTGSVRFLIDRVMIPNIGNNEIVFGRVNEKTGKTVGKKIKSPINQMYYGYKSDTFITKYAETYASVHPTPQDFSVTSPEGKRIYPISQNNWISDTVRRLNDNIDDIVTQLRKCPYQKRSVLLRDIAAKITPGIKTNDQLIRLVGFVGIKDGDKNKGADYFGMTRLEDYVSKMMMTFGKVSTIGEGDAVQKTLIDRMMILPTMADKKTYYGIIHQKLSSLFADEDVIQADGSWKFSDKTIRTFFNYFLDELDTVQQYYNKKNIAHLVNNPGQRIKNYHGKFNKKTNRLDLSGNGGMFRYCYDFIKDPTTGLNLNEMIQAKWKAQIALEEQNGKSMFRDENDETDLDGFENVRSYLDEIRRSFTFKNIREMINNHLVSIVRNELESLSSEPDLKLVQKVEENGVTSYQPLKIPRDIIQYYQEKAASKYGITYETKAYQYDSLDREACVNSVANHTINSIMSMIEYEKVFSGDQAFYKWKYKKATKQSTVDGVDVDIQVLSDKNSDRVKRLGAGLSPGDNVRAKYGDEILEKYPELRHDTYTNAYINDTSYLSSYIKDITRKFEVDRVVETIMSEKPEWFDKFKNQYEEFKDLSDQQIFNKLYLDQSSENKENYFDSLYKMIDAKTKSKIQEEVARQASPYDHVNVSDAQVLIRPELYRKIRIGLGQWSTIEDSIGYSDEKAYQILQKDDSWMSDPEKSKIVSRLQLFPLKMTYFDNAVVEESEGMPLALPRYNKMAIFPFFKYIATSKSGQQLYERMNRKNNEIDMLTFDSAVKVGANQGQPDPCETDEKGKTTNLELLTKDLLADSDIHLKDGIPTPNVAKEGGYQFPVQIQHLSRLLMQLNTEAHLDEERAIGTQMFKIAFSDIVEKATYGSNQKDSKNRTGKEIRTEIMALIDALTNKGRQEIIEQYLPDKTGTESRRSIQKRLMKQIVRSNDLGQNLIDLLNGIKGTAASEPGCIESSTSRRVFEQSVQSKVNSKVVEIHTNGGSAIQQSCFGFSGVPDFSMHGKEGVEAYDKQKYHAYNNGRQIKWNKNNGSMEVLLSMNFFKSVVPLNQQGSYTQMRQWLIDHDVIEGVKSKEYWKMSEEDAQLDQLLNTEIKDFNFSVRLLKVLESANVSTFGDILEQKDKILPLLGAKIKTELEDAFDSVNISWDTKRPKIKPVRSNPKPFGIGYRIPTQGMSSMFVFTVADVLPEQSGDLIIVPPEFTAQTGSDRQISLFEPV